MQHGEPRRRRARSASPARAGCHATRRRREPVEKARVPRVGHQRTGLDDQAGREPREHRRQRRRGGRHARGRPRPARATAHPDAGRNGATTRRPASAAFVRGAGIDQDPAPPASGSPRHRPARRPENVTRGREPPSPARDQRARPVQATATQPRAPTRPGGRPPAGVLRSAVHQRPTPSASDPGHAPRPLRRPRAADGRTGTAAPTRGDELEQVERRARRRPANGPATAGHTDRAAGSPARRAPPPPRSESRRS